MAPCILFRSKSYTAAILFFVVVASWVEFISVVNTGSSALEPPRGQKATTREGAKGKDGGDEETNEKDAEQKTPLVFGAAFVKPAQDGTITDKAAPDSFSILSPEAIVANLVFFVLPLAWLVAFVWSPVAPTLATFPLRAVQDVFFVVLNSDLLQYLGGRAFGLGEITPRPFPNVSPKKSLGGYVFAAAVSAAVNGKLFGHRFEASLLFCLLGFAGDLTASYIKRRECSSNPIPSANYASVSFLFSLLFSTLPTKTFDAALNADATKRPATKRKNHTLRNRFGCQRLWRYAWEPRRRLRQIRWMPLRRRHLHCARLDGVAHFCVTLKEN